MPGENVAARSRGILSPAGLGGHGISELVVDLVVGVAAALEEVGHRAGGAAGRRGVRSTCLTTVCPDRSHLPVYHDCPNCLSHLRYLLRCTASLTVAEASLASITVRGTQREEVVCRAVYADSDYLNSQPIQL